MADGLVLDRARSVYYHRDDRFEKRCGKANWVAPAFFTCGDEPSGILTGIRSRKGAGGPTGWSIDLDSPGNSTDVDPGPGSSLTLGWDADKGALRSGPHPRRQGPPQQPRHRADPRALRPLGLAASE